MESGNSQSYTGGFDNNFTGNTERFQCPVCLLVLRDAMQTVCGHRFCKTCIHRIMGKSTMLKCPIDKRFSKRDQIFPDIAVQRDVWSLPTRCFHESCSWTGDLRDYESHTKTCTMEMVSCPFGCDVKTRRVDADTHAESCPQRETICEYCNEKVQYQSKESHVSECPKYPMTCTYCQQADILREDLANHTDAIEGSCPEADVPCPYAVVGCTFRCRRVDMKDHILDRVSITNHLMTITSSVGKLQASVREVNDRVQELVDHNETLENRSQNLTQRLESFKKEVTLRNVTGQLHWKVYVRGSREYEHSSESFYTGCPGYKVQIDMGTTHGRDASVRFGLSLLRGEYDDQVMWPFNGLCYVTILDQKPGNKPQNLSCSMVMRDVPRNRTENRSDRLYKRTMAKTLKKDELMGNGSRFVKNGYMYMEISIVHCVYPMPDSNCPVATMSPVSLQAVNNGNMSSPPVLSLSAFLV